MPPRPPSENRLERAARLVLASASPRRRSILSRLGVAFEVVPPAGVDESAVTGTARDLACALAVRKAETVLDRLEGGEARGDAIPRVVLGADTVVATAPGPSEAVLGKPRDEDEARRMLEILSGISHVVWTGLAVASPDRPTRVEAERSEVLFHRLSTETIEEYVSTGEPLDKAGAYGIQGRGRQLVAGFSGCYLNIVGLPLVRAARMLEGLAGVSVWTCDCGAHPLQRGSAGCLRP